MAPPVVAGALARLEPHERLGPREEVGRFWTRDHSVEVDLVVADRSTPPSPPSALGSVKWREEAPFGSRDTLALQKAGASVRGAEAAALFAVSRTAVSDNAGLNLVLSPDDLEQAWT